MTMIKVLVNQHSLTVLPSMHDHVLTRYKGDLTPD